MLRLFGTIVSIFVGALAGNWAGNHLRTLVTGQLGPQLRFSQKNAQGELVIGANVVLSNFLPALLAAVIGKPRWLYAFLGGILTSGMISDRYEQRVWSLLKPQDVRQDAPGT